MSMLMPVSPGQVAKWREPRPEPVELQLAPTWAVEHVIEPDETYPNQRTTMWRNGAARIELMRVWDLPRNPGYPMQTASTRDVAGHTVHTTSMFDGAPKVVQLTWLRGNGHGVSYLVRVVFDGCDDATVSDVLTRLVVAW
jgi:hypothetical protein